MGDGPLRKKRVITPARKEQNRLAQKAFRERQKAKHRARGVEGRESSEQEELGETAGEVEVISSALMYDGATLPDEDGFAVLADPMMNGLRLLPTQFYTALMHNARALRFDPGMFDSCAHQSCPSPFYRSSTPQDDPTALHASVLATMDASTPATLLPTLMQVLIPHHACLDLIPLPSFRDQAIVLSAAMPFTFNMRELKLDIYQRGGMTCRGEGQPWVKATWEAERWFLRKWRVVVDGEIGEIGVKEERREGEVAVSG
ncbi:hypothetical protein B0I35DRAFT_435721 [Stachybotrys elegans]|uniref:BZIP domain-containing protein n=1 Tax=Stachybotrys elegans TaxID=80388 RepID=A0A8K0SLD1_9HYPO|nr:hypothetical protein B0I35DRAFT_435721 [Stachybotrys elegans]